MSNEKARVTLCGSTKFKKAFQAVNKQLTLEGYVVYSVAFFGHADNVPLTQEQKEVLDAVHFRKIDNSDAIMVIDIDHYIGESTRNEIEHAKRSGKTIKYLSDYPDLMTIVESESYDSQSEKSSMKERVRELEEGCERVIRWLKDPNTEISSSIHHLKHLLTITNRAMDKESLRKAKERSAPETWHPDNFPFDIKHCPGYEGYIPKNLGHEVCKHCGNIHYYH